MKGTRPQPSMTNTSFTSADLRQLWDFCSMRAFLSNAVKMRGSACEPTYSEPVAAYPTAMRRGLHAGILRA